MPIDEANTPVWVKILPGILGVLILAKLSGITEVFSLAINPVYLLSTLAPVIGIIIFLLRRRRVNIDMDGDKCLVYSVRVKEDGDVSSFNRIVKERAKRGYGSYLILSYYNKDGSVSSTLLLCGRSDLIEKESEIFETIVASLSGGTRIEARGTVDSTLLLDIASKSPTTSESLVNPLSSPQPATEDMGERLVYLGDNIDTPLPEPVYLKLVDLEGHVGIYGSTGSGKSTTLRSIAWQVSQLGWHVIIIDWTGEHSANLPSFTVRPDLGGFPVPFSELIKSREGRLMLVDIISHSLGLSDPQAYMLSRVMESGLSSLRDLVSKVELWPEESKWDREVKRGLRRKLEVLLGVESAFEGELRIKRGLTVVDASSIRSPRARRAYILSLLSYIYFTAAERDGRVLIAIDEAHNLFMGESRIFEDILSEARKHGVHVIYATQAPSSVPDRVFLNTNTKIVHALRSQKDKHAIQSTMGIDDFRVHLLDKLVRGEALVQAPSIPEPILVKVKLHTPSSHEFDEFRVPRKPVNPYTGIPRFKPVKEGVDNLHGG